MYNHLFLEGPSGLGKSTAIQQAIDGYLDKISGFLSQRLTCNGKVIGYRVGPVGTTTLTKEIPPPSSADPIEKGTFRLWMREGTLFKDSSVFGLEALEFIKPAKDTRLIILDEIGGVEMLDQGFRKAIYSLLQGSIPCLGVIKWPQGAKFMVNSSGYPVEILKENKDLHNEIRQNNGMIRTFSPNSPAITNDLFQFVQKAMKEPSSKA